MRTVMIVVFIWISVAASVKAEGQFAARTGRRNAQVIAGTINALEAGGFLLREQLDPAKTWRTQLASQKLNKRRSRQIYFVQFSLRNGQTVEAIAVKDNSSIPEQSGLVVYTVSKILQPDGHPEPMRK